MSGNALLRLAENDGGAPQTGLCGQWQTGAATHAAHGLTGDHGAETASDQYARPSDYPYLLRNMAIERPNQVWCADITYVPMPLGFLYLVAIMDWFSRYVVAWALSNSMEGSFCRTALQQALSAGTPTIFTTDQGSQFTAQSFTMLLEAAGVQISMDGRGRVFDNIFIERLWRTVKYEHLYLYEYETVAAVRQGLDSYFPFYNTVRPHQSLAYRTPAEVHYAV